MADILFVTSDLMFSSRATGIAGRLGVSLSTTASATPPGGEALKPETDTEPLTSAGPSLLVLDLSTPGLDVTKIVPLWRSLPNAPRILAYAPHVHTAKLAAAKTAECDAVYTKGQFDSQLEGLLAQYRRAAE